jgi:hypothetical protein
MIFTPLIPAKAGIHDRKQRRLFAWQKLGPLRPNTCLADFRGDERKIEVALRANLVGP